MKKEVLITSLCFDYKDSVLFWIFLLELNQTKVLRDFILTCPNPKIKKHSHKGIMENYSDKLDWMIRENKIEPRFFGRSFYRLLLVKDSVEQNGQLRAIPVISKDNKLHPMGGTKRLVSLILLGIKNVKVVIKEESQFQSLRDYSLASSYFKNVPENIIIAYKKWKQLFIEKDFCYE